MGRRVMAAFLAAAMGCALLTGCAADAVRRVTVQAAEVRVEGGDEADARLEAAARGADAFAFRLAAELAKNAGDTNFVCSPYSVWLPLAALLNATDETHRDTLRGALNVPGLTPGEVNAAAYRMLETLTSEQDAEPPHQPLRIANAIFVSKDRTLRHAFAQTFADFYQGASFQADFTAPDAADAVNQWAKEQTEGLIPEAVQTFNPRTAAAIVNAIYFSDRWSAEFDPAQTAEAVFHAPGGDMTADFMFRQGDQLPYYEDERVQAMPLWFKTGGSLTVLLPKNESGNELLSGLTAGYFEEIRQNASLATGTLRLPRFSAETDVRGLKEALTTLGVPLFDPTAAPLTGGLVEGDDPIWLDDAIQKAMIQVDEKGTTAAAVTVIPAPGAGLPEPTEPFEMVCDRPFVFVLCGGNGQVLFTGAVNQP